MSNAAWAPASLCAVLGQGAIILSWLISTLGLLSLDIHSMPWWSIATAMVLRVPLQTGLFILGHDAMHGLLWTSNSRLNHRLGALLLTSYAALNYERCRQLHHQHHQAAGSALDPDGPPSQDASMVNWYLQFMAVYLSPAQMSRLLAIWISFVVLFWPTTPTALLNVIAFCIAPLVLSSLQLFLVGTFLPHRCQQAPEGSPEPVSLNLPTWLSLLACYHFGYHREHHDHPELNWFQLPAAHQQTRRLAIAPLPR